MKKRELRISESNAKEQLDLFFEWYDIDFDEMYEAAQQGQGAASVRAAKSKLIKAIRQGRIEIKEESDRKKEPTLNLYQHLDWPILEKKSVQFKEVTGATRVALKTGGSSNETAKMYQLLGALSGEGAEFFLRLKRADIGIADVIGFLFLMV
jgi:hypothetical protein